MSEAGKVSLPMTPERKEEIKTIADDSWFAADNSRGAEAHLVGEVFALCEGTNELMATLEETERQISNKERSLEKFKVLASDNHTLAAKYERELAEAQQTIARLTEGVKEIRGKHVYVSGPSVVYELLGRLIEAHPPCPTCGSKNTIDHPTRADIRLCRPCDKTYMVGEGAKESNPPACPKCGNKNVAEHPTHKDVYLCLTCDRIFVAGEQP